MAAPVERINGCDPFNNQGIGIPDPGGSWEFADGGLDAGTSDFTISAWWYRSSAMTERYPTIVYKGAGGSDPGYWFHYDKDTDEINIRVANAALDRFVANSNSGLGMTADQWHYVTVVFDREPGLDTAYFYLNGEPAGTDSSALIAGDSATSAEPNVWIGTNSFIGNLDEVRVSSAVRSADWIKTEFNNQTASSTFYVLGDEAQGGGNAAPTAPTVPYSNNSSAQSGQGNPSDINDPTPAFSAIYNDPDSGDIIEGEVEVRKGPLVFSLHFQCMQF
jgi:hypothetical protein